MVENLNNKERPRTEAEEKGALLEESRGIEENLKDEILKDPKLDNIEGLAYREYPAKKATSTEISKLKRANIITYKNDIKVKNLVEDLFDSVNETTDTKSYKELWNDSTYVTKIQASLNILGKECEITGVYDNQTKEALKLFVSNYRNISDFEMDSDGKLPRQFRYVIANALIYPRGHYSKEITKKSNVSYGTPGRVTMLAKTSWFPSEGKIKTGTAPGIDYDRYGNVEEENNGSGKSPDDRLHRNI